MVIVLHFNTSNKIMLHYRGQPFNLETKVTSYNTKTTQDWIKMKDVKKKT